jgi:hypothetical protein
MESAAAAKDSSSTCGSSCVYVVSAWSILSGSSDSEHDSAALAVACGYAGCRSDARGCCPRAYLKTSHRAVECAACLGMVIRGHMRRSKTVTMLAAILFERGATWGGKLLRNVHWQRNFFKFKKYTAWQISIMAFAALKPLLRCSRWPAAASQCRKSKYKIRDKHPGTLTAPIQKKGVGTCSEHTITFISHLPV